MRIFFFLILLAGIALGIVYPLVGNSLPGEEIGRWQAYDSANGFRLLDVSLDTAAAPVSVSVELKSAAAFAVAADKPVLVIGAEKDGHILLSKTLTFSNRQPTSTSPQLGQATYRETAGEIREVEGGSYTFAIDRAPDNPVDIASVELILVSRAFAIDPRAQPLGYVLMAIGFIGFVLSVSRGRVPKNPNSMPPPARWGRGGES